MTTAQAKHWIDAKLRAPNVREVAVAQDALAPLLALIPAIQAMPADAREVTLGAGLRLAVARPEGWSSDIRWLSQADPATFRTFEAVFGALGLAEAMAPFIDFDVAPVMYSGFFVTRSHSQAATYHHDWKDGGNDGFTFIAPLTDNCRDIGLVYRDFRDTEQSYAYRQGTGLIFGDHFIHSTAPGRSELPTVLLSFTFGTDRMDRWENLSKTAGQQGMLHRRPDGVFMRNGTVWADPA